MQENFWKKLPKPFFVLAPMEDVTDVVFRKVVAKAGTPDVFFTEFTNSESFNNAIGLEALRGRLYFEEDEKPIVAHIWGDVPEYFEKMAFKLKDMGFDGVDINMGCPAPNVFKHGRGSGLILRPEKAKEIIRATKKAGLPVSVKTRLGHVDKSEYKEWLKTVLEEDIQNLSIHLRTKVEMSKVDAHYDLIPEILKLRDELAPDTLITINGDIKDYHMGMKLFEETGVDGIMIGRGVFTNPYCFREDNQNYTPLDYINLFRDHLDLYDHYTKIEPKLKKPLQRFFKIYIRDIKGAHQLRIDLMDTKTTDDVRSLLNEFEEENSDLLKSFKE